MCWRGKEEEQGRAREEVSGYVGRRKAGWGLVWDRRDDHTDVGFSTECQWGPVQWVEQRSRLKILAGSLWRCVENRSQKWEGGWPGRPDRCLT